MSSLIPERQWEDIRRMSDEEFCTLHSCEILNGEKYVGTWIPLNSRDDYIAANMRVRAEGLAVTNNSVIVREDMPIYEAIRIADSLCCPQCDFIAKSPFGLQAHQRKHNKVRERVVSG